MQTVILSFIQDTAFLINVILCWKVYLKAFDQANAIFLFSIPLALQLKN